MRENSMNDLGKMLFLFGVVLAIIGLMIWAGIGRSWLGRLPGDLSYSKGNFSFHFPLGTCLLVSALLTFLLWLFRK